MLQKRLDAFSQVHPHQPPDVVARSTHHRMNGVSRFALQVSVIKPMVRLQVPNNRFNVFSLLSG